MNRKNRAGASFHVSRWLFCLAAIAAVILLAPQSRSSLTSAAVNTTVRLNPATLVRGQQGTVTVDLITVGASENTVGFTINFDLNELSYVSASAGSSGANLLVNVNQIGAGRLGLAASRSPGSSFTTGTHQIAVITFTALATGSLPSTTPSYGDSPVLRELITVNAQALPLDVQTGTITVASSSPYEADVAPRPTGSANVVVSDWVQVGRFSVSLDTAANGTEFQRADCAPRVGLGDGKITVADWVQAGRYSVALDPLTLVGGPTTPSALTSRNLLPPTDADDGVQQRTVRAIAGDFNQGNVVDVKVELEASGDENALGFTLRFDPRKLELTKPAIVGTAATEAKLLVNDKRVADGFLAIALAMPTGKTFSVGKNRLVSLRFVQKRGPVGADAKVWFDDSLINREVVNANAERLKLVTYTPSMPNNEGSVLAGVRNQRHH